MAPEEGLEALGGLLRSEAAQVAVLELDVGSVMERFGAGRRIPLLEELAPDAARREEPATEPDQFLGRLKGAEPERRSRLLHEYVREQIAHVMALDRSRLPEPQQGLFELGMDSLMAVELRNRLQHGLGSSLPATLVFEYPTIDSLSQYLADQVVGLQPAAELRRASAAEPEDTTLARVEQLSEAEAEAMLVQKLASLERGEST
jgi:acyl carrier protein